MNEYVVGYKSRFDGNYLFADTDDACAVSVTIFKTKKEAKRVRRKTNSLWRVKSKIYKLVKV